MLGKLHNRPTWMRLGLQVYSTQDPGEGRSKRQSAVHFAEELTLIRCGSYIIKVYSKWERIIASCRLPDGARRRG